MISRLSRSSSSDYTSCYRSTLGSGMGFLPNGRTEGIMMILLGLSPLPPKSPEISAWATKATTPPSTPDFIKYWSRFLNYSRRDQEKKATLPSLQNGGELVIWTTEIVDTILPRVGNTSINRASTELPPGMPASTEIDLKSLGRRLTLKSPPIRECRRQARFAFYHLLW